MRALRGVSCVSRGHMMTPIRILIVEDEPIMSADLGPRLSRMGYAVVGIAASGETAIVPAQGPQPDVVFSDDCRTEACRRLEDG
jgi:DNA-binding NarL/FixJ family response regulator